ncbi:SDR family oxidoreductase [Actinoplanes sp. NPDC026619]|uniref:SDR family oxidoreductase n=1 Tax=Actinoplanes sp. NPDC026619 TaxID=3155798 RepID=UPI0033C4794D
MRPPVRGERASAVLHSAVLHHRTGPPLLCDGGRIITISSAAARMPNATQTSFAVSKGAVETVSRILANQLGARGITVNAVTPGATRTATNGAVFDTPGLAHLTTGMTALDRLGTPGDVADVVAFLASDAGRWVTGQVIDAGGGLFSARTPLEGLPNSAYCQVAGRMSAAAPWRAGFIGRRALAALRKTSKCVLLAIVPMRRWL